MKTRILLVDDHHIVLDGLRSLLGSQDDMEVVGAIDNGLEAMDLVRDLRPDLVVMDVTMPGLNGIEVTRHIHEHADGTRILALSMHVQTEMVAAMARAGASAYLPKSTPVATLLESIRKVAAGYHLLEPTAEVSGPGGAVPATVRLSDREREVLQLLAEGKTSQRIGELLFVSTRTVDWHRRSIMQKLGLHSVAELTKYAVRTGLTSLDP
jgi:DNA-binding NarL/FixJ family response regulator